MILDHPDGYVTYVDYESREVQVNINRAMGARPQMVMSVFDSRSPGVPTEKPKGTHRADQDRRPVQRRADRQDQ